MNKNVAKPISDDHFGLVSYWSAVWCGVAASGALFSGVFGAPGAFPIACFLGGIYTGLIGGPLVFAACCFARLAGRPKSLLAVGLSGGVTGFACWSLLAGVLSQPALAGGVFGVLGATSVGWWLKRPRAGNRYSVIDMLFATAGLATLLAVWRVMAER